MSWLPDTNVWIQILKRAGGILELEMLRHPADQILLCSVVKAELWHGAQKYGRVDRRLAVLTDLFAGFKSLPFDDNAAWRDSPSIGNCRMCNWPERSKDRLNLYRA